MSIDTGTQLGPYEIVARLGAGGMGEVFRAHDSRLGRDVAIKVLSSRISSDPSSKKRFLREARALSAISHSNICSLFDIGSVEGTDFLIMEYLEGETLARKLAAGPLPLDQALVHAVEIAGALDHAHRKGIVHRDLKPGNIMLTKPGVKLLDFGLARLTESKGSTIEPLTSVDTVIGTIDYMAPEQLNGEAIDARTDIFAFGVVLYEMLTGERPFQGSTRASIIGSILFGSPKPLLEIDDHLPAALDGLIRACLEKNPDDRIQTAHDLRLQLRWIGEGASEADSRPWKKRKRLPVNLGWVAAALLALLAAAAGTLLGRRAFTIPRAEEIRFAITATQSGEELDSPVLSPDGKRLAFVTEGADGQRFLWVRDLSSTVPRKLPGTEGASFPFWSPDGDALGFDASGQELNVIELSATSPRVLVSANSVRGASWGKGGTILYTPRIGAGLFTIAAAGGRPVPLTQLDAAKGDRTHRWPEFLPDGKRFLFVVGSTDAARAGLYIGSLDSKQMKKISDVTHRAMVVEPDRIFFVRDRRLYVQRFDMKRGELAGKPALLAENVFTDLKFTGAVAFSAARNGTYVHLTKPDPNCVLTWYDRSRNPLGTVGPPAQYVNPAISNDGRQLAISRIDPSSGKNSLWTFDLENGRSTRITVDDNDADGPMWSHDDSSIYFSSNRRGPYEIYEKPLAGAKPERLIIEGNTYSQMFSARKAARLYHVAGDTVRDGAIWYWPSGSAPKQLNTPSGEGGADLSPDSAWIAYTREDGATSGYDVYVHSIADPNLKIQVSQGGGAQPTWSADGKELFFVRRDKQLMVVRFKPGEAMAPRPLFALDMLDIFYGSRDYVPAPDGWRILVQQRVSPNERATATVVVNSPALP